MPFVFEEIALPEVKLVTPTLHNDERGFFFERYKESAFAAAGITDRFVQDNHSCSSQGVIRGLHFQVGSAVQAKLVWVTQGEVFDAVVDLRRGSATFGQWAGHVLSGEDRKMLYVPEGFGHGFAVLSRGAHVSYKVTAEYSAEHERGVRWNDPEIGVDWPVNDPILSEKDRALPLLKDAEILFQCGP